MKCNWCTNEPTQAGRAPDGTVGLTRALACDTHAYLIERLGYTPMTLVEVRQEQRREAREVKK